MQRRHSLTRRATTALATWLPLDSRQFGILTLALAAMVLGAFMY